MKARHPHQRYHAGAVACGALGLDGLDVNATVLGVIHQKIRTDGAGHLRHARYKKLEHHGANRHVTVRVYAKLGRSVQRTDQKLLRNS